MATVQTIATTLTNDNRQAVQSLRTFDAEVDKTFTRLDLRNKRILLGSPQGLFGGSRGAMGLLELSRGAEDAAVAFGTNGLQGAIRGSINNLTSFATIAGGPAAGAMAGFAAAGVAILTPFVAKLFEAGDGAKRLAEQIELATQKTRDLAEARMKTADADARFFQQLRGVDSSQEARNAIDKRRDDMESIAAQIKEIDDARRKLFTSDKAAGMPLSAFGPDTEAGRQAVLDRLAAGDRLDLELIGKKAELLRREATLRGEIASLRAKGLDLLEKERELQKQKDAEEFAGIIRNFQIEDEKEQEREAKRQAEKLDRDRQRLEEMLQGQSERLGVPKDRLRGLDVPDAMRPELESLFRDLDALDQRPGNQFAQVATRDSQALLRLQSQAKEAAEAKQQRQKLIERIEKLIEEIKGLRRDGQDPINGEDVNIT